MKQRNQSPTTNQKDVLGQRLKTNRDMFGVQLVRPMYKYYPYPALADKDKLLIQGYETGCGDAPIILPFRLLSPDTSDFYQLFQMEITDSWALDLNTSTIDLVTFTGGIIDGSGAYAADSDYLVWAFISPGDVESARFKGFGISKRPITTGVTVTSGGGLGASTVFNVGANNGYKYTVGSRVLAREGVAVGDDFNQGTVTAIAANSVTVTLDAAYGIANSTNTTLAGTPGVTLLQMNMFEPRMWTSPGTLYPGNAAAVDNYQYLYMGMIQSDNDTDVKMFRKPGDIYHLSNAALIFSVSGAAASSNNVVCLSRWTPRNIRESQGRVNVARITGSGTVIASWGYGQTTTASARISVAQERATTNNAIAWDTGPTAVSANNTMQARLAFAGGVGTFDASFSLHGYVWEEW